MIHKLTKMASDWFPELIISTPSWGILYDSEEEEELEFLRELVFQPPLGEFSMILPSMFRG